MADPSRPDGLVFFGRISGLFGVQGWVKVFSHARPREAIIGYSPWLVKIDGDWREIADEEGRAHGKGVVARLAGNAERDPASATGATEERRILLGTARRARGGQSRRREIRKGGPPVRYRRERCDGGVQWTRAMASGDGASHSRSGSRSRGHPG